MTYRHYYKPLHSEPEILYVKIIFATTKEPIID